MASVILARPPVAGGTPDEGTVPPSLSDIEPYLRAADEVEAARPRVAYRCRFRAFEKAHQIDPTSSGRGVRQFKTALLERLERDNEPSLQQRLRSTDAREVQSYYQDYYRKYLAALDNPDEYDRAQLARAYQTAGVLFEVLCALNEEEKGDVDPQLVEAGQKVQQKAAEYIPFNILPLDAAGASQAIMQLPEIIAATSALRNIGGLPRPPSIDRNDRSVRDWDILDWLKAMFGFQQDNVRNQREHMVLLLANANVRLKAKDQPGTQLSEKAVQEVMSKVTKNYRTWCKFIGEKKNLADPPNAADSQQRKLIYISLYLLIWGEAANLRFLPECLCYIFHHMAGEVIGMISGNTSTVTGMNIQPAYGGGDDGFLRNVVTPIYEIIKKEADNSCDGTAPHSAWRNYDDFNEFFWDKRCLRLGWPMKQDTHAFFAAPVPRGKHAIAPAPVAVAKRSSEVSKTFVEYRSFWNLFRSYDRMWTFFIIVLQAMIVMAFAPNWYAPFTNMKYFKQIISVFITAAALRFVQAALDLFFSYGMYRSMKRMAAVRLILKLLVAAVWVILLSILYVKMWNITGVFKSVKDLASATWNSRNVYIVVCAIYLVPNLLQAVLFCFPMLRRWLEQSNWQIIKIALWWSQTSLYVGRGMHESQWTLFKYVLFWVLLLACKLLFSYNLTIKPLVKPTRDIVHSNRVQYDWPEICPNCNSNAGAVFAIWAPVILVYFMDLQIWYSIFATLSGGVSGAFARLGEIRTLGMLRARFRTIPSVFCENLIPLKDEKSRRFKWIMSFKEVDTKEQATKFAQLWNEMALSFREEDLISNRELDLMTVPYSSTELHVVQWPPFLLASKIHLAIQIAAGHTGGDVELKRQIKADDYMRLAVEECFASMQLVLEEIIQGANERLAIKALIEEMNISLDQECFVSTFNTKALPSFCAKLVELTVLLMKPDPEKRSTVVRTLQDMFEIVVRDMLSDQAREGLEKQGGPLSRQKTSNLFASPRPDSPTVLYPPPSTGAFQEQIKRFHLLLTMKDTAMDVPANLEARRRLEFFTNSLYMDMPRAPKIRRMVSFSVLTPYYSETVSFTKKELNEENEDGISILFYLQKIYPDEWTNFLQRTGCKDEEDALRLDDGKQLRLWASYRGQTLARTVRGMMYYRRALQLQAFLDSATDDQIAEGYKEVLNTPDDLRRNQKSMWNHIRAIADMKFTYVVSCQIYGAQKRKGLQQATEIFELMKTYEALRVAYIDEVEVDEKGKTKTDFYSVLVKADSNGLEEEIYRIKLPGNPKLGEGKPENQNHAIVFTRGEALQTIDMNQDHYLEETFKMRNLLEEFKENHGVRPATILGVREHIFTGSVSSLAWFMSQQEMSFVTIGQRVLAHPLKVRFHYGHPDVFDRLFHITRGGMSKAARVIHISEDIFAGFNSTLRRGNITHHEYMTVGKGRDVGLNQVSLFEAKVASGNGEQTLTRDIYRLGHRFDFFRMLSFWITTIGFYFCTMMVVLILYAFLYGKLYLVLSGIEAYLVDFALQVNDKALLSAINAVALVQLGILMGLPMVMEMGLERGFRKAFLDFLIMQLQLASVFFTFSLGSKTHFYGRTLLHGGAKYRATGRGFVVRHEKFAENYRLFSRSHFTKALEILLLLIIWMVYGSWKNSGSSYVLISFTMWFLVTSWLFGPFIFNPSGFEWQKTVEDYEDWVKWLSHKGGIGVTSSESWESWWEEEQEHLKYTGLWGRICEVILSLRFFLFQYGIVYHLHVVKHKDGSPNNNVYVYGISWIVIAAVMIVTKIITAGRKKLSADFQLMFRLLKALLFTAGLTVLVVCLLLTNLDIGDIFASLLAFIPTGWGILCIAQALRPVVTRVGLWGSVMAFARAYEWGMGIIIFAPIAVLSWLPFVSTFQTRLLFNTAFSRGLQISRILAGRKR